MSKLLTAQRRIAIVGTYHSGKTVFLTSLLNHLEEFDDRKFHIGRPGTSLSGFRKLDPPEREREFRYEAFRDALVNNNRWPAKTGAASHYRCRVTRSDWSLFDLDLHFYDFPGERLADACVAACESFGEWSQYLLNHFQSRAAYREHVQPYLDLLRGDNPAEADIIHAYKESLARLILDYKPLICPSTFLLGIDGSQARKGPVEKVIHGRFSGLPPHPKSGECGEFTPLPESFATDSPKLWAAFERRYQIYRRTVALPVFLHLKACNRMIVLVDIPTLLMGGTGMYNDNRQILKMLLETVDKTSTIGGMLEKVWSTATRLWDYLTGDLARVAFVAAKSDLVNPQDRDRLERLLRRMTNKFAGQLPPATQSRFFTASAIRSTISGGEGGTRLKGRPMLDNPDKLWLEYDVTRLPEDWPSTWEPGAYHFPIVLPQMPENTGEPPDHLNLDRVFDFIVG